jgi:hypothetical protein
MVPHLHLSNEVLQLDTSGFESHDIIRIEGNSAGEAQGIAISALGPLDWPFSHPRFFQQELQFAAADCAVHQTHHVSDVNCVHFLRKPTDHDAWPFEDGGCFIHARACGFQSVFARNPFALEFMEFLLGEETEKQGKITS